MMNWIKKFYVEHYQRWRWYESFTIGEYSKFVNIVSPTLVFAILTWAKVNNYSVSLWKLGIGYILLSAIAVVIGKWLVYLGIASYNNKIANHQNKELMEVVEWVREQRKKENERR